MSSQNVSTTAVYMAYNTTTGAYVTGDVANHTLKLVKDGTEASPTNAASEVDSTNAPGAYKLTLTAAETQFGTVWIGGKSATANVIIVPITLTFEILPTALDSNSNIKTGITYNSSTGRVSILDNLQQNTALTGFMFTMLNSTTGLPQTGLSVTAQRSLGGAALGACANSPTEVGNGVYSINLVAADLNAASVMFRFTAAGALDTDVEVITTP